MHRLSIGVVVLGIALSLAAKASGAVEFQEKPFGNGADYDVIKAVTFSTDSRHLAFLGVKDGKQFVVRDGVVGEPHDWIVPNSLSGPLDLSRLAYIIQDGNDMAIVVDGKVVGQGYYAIGGERIAFSPDGKHFAYTAHTGSNEAGQTSVVHDGVAGKAYPRVDLVPTFSPDGQHLLYIASPAPNKMCLVVDEKEGPTYDAIAQGTAIFSPDSKRVAYAVASNNKVVAVVDGKPGPEYGKMQMPPIFSPDSTHVAYIAGDGRQFSLILDGVEQPKYDRFTEGAFTFSPDSRHIAYAAGKGKQWVLVVDGKEQKAYDSIAGESIHFSPDSQHLGFVQITGGKRFIVVDGKDVSPGYANVLWPGPIFSPDSKRVAYVGAKEKQLAVVLDGKEQAGYDNIADLEFSPDSKHLSYRAIAHEHALIVMDGVASPEFDNTSGVAFSPDGTHWTCCAAQGDKGMILLDGQPVAQTFAGWVKGSRPAFADARTIDYLMVRDRQFLQVRASLARANSAVSSPAR